MKVQSNISGVFQHAQDEGIIYVSSTSLMHAVSETSNQDLPEPKAVIVENATPQAVRDFLLLSPKESIKPLTFAAQKQFNARLDDESGMMLLNPKDRVLLPDEVAGFFEHTLTNLAFAAESPKAGSARIRETKLIICEDMANTVSQIKTAKLHIDTPKNMMTRTLHGHIGITSASSFGDHELEFLTTGPNSDSSNPALTHHDVQSLLGYTGHAKDHPVLNARIDATHTGDFIAFWGPAFGKMDYTKNTLAHRTASEKAVLDPDRRKYSIIMYAAQPSDLDFGLDNI